MCEANVYLVDEKGEEKLIFESVDKITPNGSGLCLENIFSQRKYIKAKIKEVSLANLRVTLERAAE
jgi:predicted RNA-binding protein